MRFGGSFVLANEASVVVDPAACASDHPAAGLYFGPAGWGFGGAGDLDGHAVLRRGLGACGADVAAAWPDMLGRPAGAFSFADRRRERGTVLDARGVTYAASSSPPVSTATWRPVPSVMFAPHGPRGSASRRCLGRISRVRRAQAVSDSSDE